MGVLCTCALRLQCACTPVVLLHTLFPGCVPEFAGCRGLLCVVCIPCARGSQISTGAGQGRTVRITTAHSLEWSKGRQKTQNTQPLPQQERGAAHTPRVRSLPGGLPSPLRAQPVNSPLQICRKSKQANKNPQKKNQTKPSTNQPKAPRKQPYNSSPNFSQRSYRCQDLRQPAPLPSPTRESARCPDRAGFNPAPQPPPSPSPTRNSRRAESRRAIWL